jgi:hypothetical protein
MGWSFSEGLGASAASLGQHLVSNALKISTLSTDFPVEHFY